MGATSGIGLRVAEIFAKAGWLVGAAGRNEKVMRKLQSDFPDRIRYARINIDDAASPPTSVISSEGSAEWTYIFMWQASDMKTRLL